MVVEHDRLVFLLVDVDDFFPLGDCRQRLIDDLEGFERIGSGVQLSQAAINEQQAGHFLLFFLQPLVAARDHFAHGGKVIHALHAANDELAVVGFLHSPVFPDHHRRHGFGALNVRDIETLDALRRLRQAERLLQSLLDCFRVRLHHPEALVIGLLRIVPCQIEERAFLPALGHEDVHACGAGPLARQLFRENLLEHGAIFKLDRNVNIPGHVRLPDIKLAEQGGKKNVRIEISRLPGSARSRVAVYAESVERGCTFPDSGAIAPGRGFCGAAQRPRLAGPARRRFELRQFLPKKLPPIEHPSAAHVKQVHRQHSILVVIAKYVRVIPFDSRDSLLLLQLLDRRNQIPILRCPLVLLLRRSFLHARAQGT